MLDNHILVKHFGAMKLAQYLKESGVRQEDFAEVIGISQSQVSRLVKDRLKPSFGLLEKIDQATGGRVSFSDFRSLATDEASDSERAVA